MKASLKILLISLILTSCTNDSSVKVCFVTDLSSRNSQLGISGRNGIMIAVEEINNNRGINGKEVELILVDHKGQKDECYKEIKAIIEREIDLIVGPLTSGMADAVISASGGNVLIISPTVSTDLLSGIDDNFLRVIAPASTQGIYLAQAIASKGNKKVVVVFDENNVEYARGVINGLEVSNREQGIEYIYLSFTSKLDFRELSEEIYNNNPDGVLFVTNGINAGGILQQYAKKGPLPDLYGSTWLKISEVLLYGGKIIEGMIVVDSYLPSSLNEKEKEFNNKYEVKFNTKPNIASRYSYESLMLFERAANTIGETKYEEVKKSILGMKSIKGITDNYRFNKFGDVIRKQSLFIIRNNNYEFYEIDYEE